MPLQTTPVNKAVKDFDVLIFGSGPSGAVAAFALSILGRRVLVVTSRIAPPSSIGEVLPSATVPILRKLGLLSIFLSQDHKVCSGTLSSWGSSQPTEMDALNNIYGAGWHLDRHRFNSWLQLQAELAGAIFCETRERPLLARKARQWEVSLSNGQFIRCKWTIDATGRRCAIARQHGAVRFTSDRLVGTYAVFHPGKALDADSRTMIEAVPGGWWYTALVPSGNRIVAFFTDKDLLGAASVRSAIPFQAALQNTLLLNERVLSRGYVLAQAPRGADSSSAWLSNVFGNGWLAIGDAALSFDPVSSQGLFHALYTGMKGADAVDAALGGRENEIIQYALRINSIRTAYRSNLSTCYRSETRWATSQFWLRRQ